MLVSRRTSRPVPPDAEGPPGRDTRAEAAAVIFAEDGREIVTGGGGSNCPVLTCGLEDTRDRVGCETDESNLPAKKTRLSRPDRAIGEASGGPGGGFPPRPQATGRASQHRLTLAALAEEEKSTPHPGFSPVGAVYAVQTGDGSVLYVASRCGRHPQDAAIQEPSGYQKVAGRRRLLEVTLQSHKLTEENALPRQSTSRLTKPSMTRLPGGTPGAAETGSRPSWRPA